MICKLADIGDIVPDTWHEFSLQTKSSLVSIMLIHQNGEFRAFKNSCPHQGRRMDYVSGKFLISAEGHLVCPAHGAEFNPTTGLCLNGPCFGQSLESIYLKSDEKNLYTVVK